MKKKERKKLGRREDSKSKRQLMKKLMLHALIIRASEAGNVDIHIINLAVLTLLLYHLNLIPIVMDPVWNFLIPERKAELLNQWYLIKAA